MNEFSIVCRILGSLFYRSPDEAVMTPLLTVIQRGKLQEQWPLEQGELLTRLGQEQLSNLVTDYQHLFGKNGQVVAQRSHYLSMADTECRTFLQQVGMSIPAETPADQFGLLLLTASWIEDQAVLEDKNRAQLTLFEQLLLPWSARFLGRVEACATTVFYRTLAIITRGALTAMYEELTESVTEADE